MASLDLYLLNYFLAVVETGSFTRAADRVFVTQPTLSSGIKKLETQVGHILFERTNRRVFLTDAGTRFLPRAKAILHECNMAVQSLAETDEVPVIRIGVLVTLSNRMIGGLLAGFRDLYPNVTIEVRDGTEQELLNRLDDRSLDYALSVYRGEDAGDAVTLYREPYVFILSKDHELAKRRRLSAGDLSSEKMVVRSRCEVLSETSRYFTDRNIRPRLVYRTNNDARAVALVAAGIGGTVVPECLVDDWVVKLALEGFDYNRRIALFKPKYQLTDDVALIGRNFEQYVTDQWAAEKT